MFHTDSFFSDPPLPDSERSLMKKLTIPQFTVRISDVRSPYVSQPWRSAITRIFRTQQHKQFN
jgi:hypothetical protein